MRLKLQTNSRTAWTAVLNRIKGAQSSIYIEMYIFSDDTTPTHDFVSALIERAHAQVQVIMILDAFGSIGLKQATIARLEAAGVEVRFFRHWIHRTHRKTIIIDNRRAFVGGVNITQHAQSWNDLQIEVSGLIVPRLVKVFARTYKLSRGTQTLRVAPRHNKRKHRVRMWILEHTPLASILTMKQYYLRKLKEARTSVTLVTPYFIPHSWLLNAIESAVKRGVVVDIVIPLKTETRIIDMINHYYATIARRRGAHVYVTPGTNHAKAVLIDEKEGLIGSGNIDSLSFERNSELGIFFTHTIAVAELSEVICTWKNSAQPDLAPGDTTLPWYYFLLVFVLKIIHPFI